MRSIVGTGVVLLSGILWIQGVRAAEPYLRLEAGILSRDVVEEDPSLEGFKVRGEADSTRLMVKAGMVLGELLDLYLQGGGANLEIKEFNDYDADLSGAYGGGVRLTLYRSPYRDHFTLFVEFSALRFETDDQVETEICSTGCDTDSPNFLAKIVDETIEWSEYTVLLGGSGSFEGLRPYGGIRLSRVDGTDKVRLSPDSDFPAGFSERLDLSEDDIFGIFLGTDIFLDRSEKTAINFEVSLFDQDSFRAAIRRAF